MHVLYPPVRAAQHDLLAFTAFPREIRRQMWSNNPRERASGALSLGCFRWRSHWWTLEGNGVAVAGRPIGGVPMKGSILLGTVRGLVVRRLFGTLPRVSSALRVSLGFGETPGH